MKNNKEYLEGLTISELLKFLTSLIETFYLPYSDSMEAKSALFDTEMLILDIIKKKLTDQYLGKE